MSYNTRGDRHSGCPPVGMFVVRVIWPIKPRGDSATPALSWLQRRDQTGRSNREDEIADHASRVARRLRGSAYRTRFCCLDVEATPCAATHDPGSGTLFDARLLRAFSASANRARSTRHQQPVADDSRGLERSTVHGTRDLCIFWVLERGSGCLEAFVGARVFDGSEILSGG